MATSTLRALRAHRPHHVLLLRPPHRRWTSTNLTTLTHEMTTRLIPPIYDDLTPTPSHRLTLTLADYLPHPQTHPTHPPATTPTTPLPLPHHLLYFEPTQPTSAMLPDGTNPTHSPGPPYTRRMWAGGRVAHNPSHPLTLDGTRGVCAEFIRAVTPKGRPGEEKLFVGIERRLARLTADETTAYHASLGGSRAERDALDHRVRQRLWRPDETDFGPASLVETRNIVFMRAAPPHAPPTTNKKLPPTRAPDWRHTIVPDARLLFRFSALTFNAHAIHLDPEYCRAVEGHRERLFHGPLSYVFMLTVLRGVLEGEGRGERVTGVEYRNLAPLYLGEPVTFCGARVGEARWEVWTETPEGGVAVKGTVATERA